MILRSERILGSDPITQTQGKTRLINIFVIFAHQNDENSLRSDTESEFSRFPQLHLQNSFGTWNLLSAPGIDRDRHTQCPCKSLKCRFNNMMRINAIKLTNV